MISIRFSSVRSVSLPYKASSLAVLLIVIVANLMVSESSLAEQIQSGPNQTTRTTVPASPPMPGERPTRSLDVQGSIKTARVYFIHPKDGDVVKSPFVAKFGIEGLKVAKAGSIVPGTGHFHILINSEPAKEGQTIPADERHIHLGKGETELTMNLKPGEHTLTLQFADGLHRAYTEMLVQTIKITVK